MNGIKVGNSTALASGSTIVWSSLTQAIIFSIVLSGCLEPPRASDAASGMGSLRTIVSANEVYRESYRQGYAPTLAALGNPENGICDVATAVHACLIDSVLASGRKSSYLFTYTAGPPDKDGKITTYIVHGDPIQIGRDGMRSFYVDQTGVIRMERDRAATSTSPVLQ